MEILGIVAGALVFIVLLWWVNKSHYDNKMTVKRERSIASPYAIRIKAATIADDMVPLFDQLVETGVKLRILGSDGCYLHGENAQVWLNGLNAWMEKGASIEYIVLCPTKQASKELKKLEISNDNKFTIVEVSQEKFDALNFTALRGNEKYLTLHPTLLEKQGADGEIERAMWIEYFHPENSEYAYNVEFYSPTAMGVVQNKIFTEFDADFNTLVK